MKNFSARILSKIKADWSGEPDQSALTPPAYAHVIRLRNPPLGGGMAAPTVGGTMAGTSSISGEDSGYGTNRRA